jgi:hypothetical protein
MAGKEKRRALVLAIFQKGSEFTPSNGIKAARDFIKDEEFRGTQEGLGDANALEHAFAELAVLLLDCLGEPDDLE